MASGQKARLESIEMGAYHSLDKSFGSGSNETEVTEEWPASVQLPLKFKHVKLAIRR